MGEVGLGVTFIPIVGYIAASLPNSMELVNRDGLALDICEGKNEPGKLINYM